jgi:type I restriction enzyme M protein
MQNVSLLPVPRGKVIDFVDGKLRGDTPEEYVRQEMEKSLVREYRYLRAEIAVEFKIKMGILNKRVDLAVFPEGTPQKQEHIWAIVECKAPDISPNDRAEGVAQLKGYLAACLNAEYGVWTNGQGGERLCFRKIRGEKALEFADINDIPVKGKSLDDAERPNLGDLRPATSDALLFTFKRCHNYIAGNQGLQKADAFWELLKLIFCKIADERSDELTFFATTQERQSLNGQLKVKKRLDRLFTEVKERYQTIFRPNDAIDLEHRVLAYIVAQLQPFSLLDSDVDVKGKAYEEIVGSNLRGDRGEFFTPRNVCRLAVEMLDPTPQQTVLDPACGTGGFLVIGMNHVIQKIRTSEMRKWRDKGRPSEREQSELLRRIREYADKRMLGIDINPSLVRAAKMNMVMNNDGSGSLFQGNSLERPVTWNDALRSRKLVGQVDVVFTNPPFGSKIRVDDPAILEQYELAHVWDYDKATDTYRMREPKRLRRALPPEILFVERCVQFLKPGTGRLAIVLPDGILGAPRLGYVREWILRETRVLASIDLHPDTFQPQNSTQTSILVLERKTFEEVALETAAGKKQDYNVFMALANHVGHDRRGNATYVRDADGKELWEARPQRVLALHEVHENAGNYGAVDEMQRVRDDNTAQIGAAFRAWVAEQQ